MNVKLVVVAATLLTFLGIGVVRNAGRWQLGSWVGFLLRLGFCVALVLLAVTMALGVDSGVTRAWGPGARYAYVIGMMLMMLYGVISGVQLLRAFAGDEVEPRLYHGYLGAFAILILILAAGAWLEESRGVPFERSGAVIVGLFSLYLGASPPDWFLSHGGVQLLERVLGRLGTRLLYAGLGLLLLSAGILGTPVGLLR